MKKITLLLTLVCAGQIYGMEPERIHNLPQELQREIIITALAASESVDEITSTIKATSALYGIQFDKIDALNLLIKTLPNDLDMAINKTKNLQGTTQQDFTKLVHLLADRFNTSTKNIAKKINTPTAKKYNLLFKEFRTVINMYAARGLNKEKFLGYINKYLADGLDVNYVYSYVDWKDKEKRISLFQLVFDKWKQVVSEENIRNAANREDIMNTLAQVINLLREKGAKPSAEFIEMLKQAEQQ